MRRKQPAERENEEGGKFTSIHRYGSIWTSCLRTRRCCPGLLSAHKLKFHYVTQVLLRVGADGGRPRGTLESAATCGTRASRTSRCQLGAERDAPVPRRTIAPPRDVSLNPEPAVIEALSDAALTLGRTHEVILMVELGIRGAAATSCRWWSKPDDARREARRAGRELVTAASPDASEAEGAGVDSAKGGAEPLRLRVRVRVGR